jgi:hypothetical protein
MRPPPGRRGGPGRSGAMEQKKVTLTTLKEMKQKGVPVTMVKA